MDATHHRPIDLLRLLYHDPQLDEMLSLDTTVGNWCRVESAMAAVQAELGLVPPAAAAAIAEVCADWRKLNLDAMWRKASVVGYPILGLVEQIEQALPPDARGWTHLGATTQDVMDSALALQIRDTGALLDRRILDVGDALSELARTHRCTVMAGRTHGQQAVPTTFGAKLAVYLAEFTRHRRRLLTATAEAAKVSLFGAAGTSAGHGEQAAEIRRGVAAALQLADTSVPWHVARDSLNHFVQAIAAAAATCVRFAREVVDLSRNEIGEVFEESGHHRGASSTMPQKANPITSEAVIGLGIAATTYAGGMHRVMEAAHERAAGEWQLEWTLVPNATAAAGAALWQTAALCRGLVVHADRMVENMSIDGGLIMAEALMLELAATMGRSRAHDYVYGITQYAREAGLTLAEALAQRPVDAANAGTVRGQTVVLAPRPADYLGSTGRVADDAVAAWYEQTADREWKGITDDDRE